MIRAAANRNAHPPMSLASYHQEAPSGGTQASASARAVTARPHPALTRCDRLRECLLTTQMDDIGGSSSELCKGQKMMNPFRFHQWRPAFMMLAGICLSSS